MHYKPCSEIIGGARALLPMEDCAYVALAYGKWCHNPRCIVIGELLVRTATATTLYLY